MAVMVFQLRVVAGMLKCFSTTALVIEGGQLHKL